MFVRGLAASPWHDASRLYSPLLSALQSVHSTLIDALDDVTTAGLTKPQPEGLQEPGQERRIFDIGQACESGGSESPGATSDAANDGDRGAASTEDAGEKSSLRPALVPVCKVLQVLRKTGARASPPYAPLKVQVRSVAM